MIFNGFFMPGKLKMIMILDAGYSTTEIDCVSMSMIIIVKVMLVKYVTR